MIKIVANQVKRADWNTFIESIQDVDLYRLVLDIAVSLQPLWDKYKANPKVFDDKLLDLAETKIQSDSFKRPLIDNYRYDNVTEVRALMFMIFEVYRRIRLQRDDYTGTGGYLVSKFSFMAAPKISREDKVSACKVLKEFVLNADRLDNIDGYLQEKRLYAHKGAINDGTVKALVAIMSEIMLKMPALQPRQ
jgi:hypothetical protein